MKLNADSPRPACEGEHELFDSRDPLDHAIAKNMCNRCPVIDACKDNLRDVIHADKRYGGSPEGTWAGRFFGNPRLTLVEVEQHGTPNGYQQHRWLKEKACDECRLAHNAAERERARLKREAGAA